MPYRLLESACIEGGRITVFAEPDPAIYCAAGIDFAYGLPTGDYDAAIILGSDGEQKAVAHGHWGESFADILWPILQWYKPFVVGERQVGLPTLRRLYDKGYSWMYFDRNYSAKSMAQRDALGHHSKKGDVIIPMLQNAIAPRNSAGEVQPPKIAVHDQQTYHELAAYQFVPRGAARSIENLTDADLAYSAPPGEHDDLVMALAFAWAGVQWLPQYNPPAPEFPNMSLGKLYGTPATHAAAAKTRQKDPFKI